MRRAVLVYLAAVVAANLSIGYFGPVAAPVNAFLFIGLDLALRDHLGVRLPVVAMLALIIVASALTLIISPGTAQIARASAAAFAVAALLDWWVFRALAGRSWAMRGHLSNVFGAAADSTIFPVLAFGAVMPSVTAAQFLAKVAGGALWVFVLARKN